MKPRYPLYRSRDLSGQWVARDKHGHLMTWPAEPKGWLKRTAYTGPQGALEEVEPALARGSGWFGGGRARKPRSPTGKPARPVSIRATEDERAAWQNAADEDKLRLSEWCRGELNTAVDRRKDPRAARPASKRR